jgi:tRNA A-37 threonylcarbamoyl transferase component Bud32
MTRVTRWKRGDATLWTVVEEWLAGSPPVQEFADHQRRKVVRLRTDPGVDVVVKRFLPQRRLQRLIGAGRRLLAMSGAQREWRALSRLRSAGASVPEPLALAKLHDGGELLVVSFVPGRPLADALADPAPERRRLLNAVGDQVALLHSCRIVHRDLHIGNFIVDSHGLPVLLDFQRARRSRSPGARYRDIGALDFSLAQASVSLADRLRLRTAALGISDLSERHARLTLTRVGAASLKRAERHYRSRTRRCLRPGRLIARIDLSGRTGLRLREVPAETISQALAIHEAVQAGDGALASEGAILKRDHRSLVTAARVEGRSLVVKQVVKQGIGRLLADALRGSPARRAWLGGHGLLARGIRAATPLGFIEARRLFIPIASIIVLEDVRPAEPANEVRGATRHSRTELAETLRRLALSLHTKNVSHGDLQAPHIYLSPQGGRLTSVLIDLEGVRFRRRLSDKQRIQSLAELNASLPDDLLSAEERRRAFERYAQVLPFGQGRAAQSERLAAERQIVERSLARDHLWKGEGCREIPWDENEPL